MTSIEFLSPSNKLGRGRQAYVAKQQLMIDGKVNIAEVDLVRAGEWTLAIDLELVPVQKRGLYRAAVVRATVPENGEYYPIRIDQPLPTLRIPLLPDNDDVNLPLQPLLDLAYSNGGYGDIDYSQPPTPHLPQDITEWAKGWIEKSS